MLPLLVTSLLLGCFPRDAREDTGRAPGGGGGSSELLGLGLAPNDPVVAVDSAGGVTGRQTTARASCEGYELQARSPCAPRAPTWAPRSWWSAASRRRRSVLVRHRGSGAMRPADRS